MKEWVLKAQELLAESLNPVPSELNELDWKEDLSSNSNKLNKHLTAFANKAGGGFMAYGIKNQEGEIAGVTSEQAENVIRKIGNLCRDAIKPMVSIDHSIVEFNGKSILFFYIKESAVKPVYIGDNIEECYVRSGGSTRKASRYEMGTLMLNSKTPQFEELYATTLKKPSEILSLLDYNSLFALLKKPVPSTNN